MSDRECYRLGIGVVYWQKLRAALIKSKWIVETNAGDYTFIRSFETLSLWDLTVILATPLADLPKKLQHLPKAEWVDVFLMHRENAAESAKNALALNLSELFKPKT